MNDCRDVLLWHADNRYYFLPPSDPLPQRLRFNFRFINLFAYLLTYLLSTCLCLCSTTSQMRLTFAPTATKSSCFWLTAALNSQKNYFRSIILTRRCVLLSYLCRFYGCLSSIVSCVIPWFSCVVI